MALVIAFLCNLHSNGRLMTLVKKAYFIESFNEKL